MTSQVSFRRTESRPPSNHEQSNSRKQLTEQNFLVDTDEPQWQKFLEASFTVMKDRESGSVSTTSLVNELQQHLPHWTSACSDKIVYTTVEEAHSGSTDDVGSYLAKLKRDLCIGLDGYPKYVIIGGDQQTYAIMNKLKQKYTDRYDWVYPVPGDWHIMKTASEVLKNVLMDGGFKVLAAKCGHKGDVTQWQDIHNVLAASHEAILRSAVDEFLLLDKGDTAEAFWTWVQELPGSNDQVACFWSKMLVYLHAYVGFYFSIRSGNWSLRNSCLKILNELFFAYSRDKFEVLTINALSDVYTYPGSIIEYFQDGQWTVSIKGRPYHSVALDEAQECVINRKLKQITTRASHFRMVDLADFMAYLDVVVTGLDVQLFKHHKQHEQTDKGNISARANILYTLLQTKRLFHHVGELRELQNVFVDSPPQLPQQNIDDLLSITKKGTDRMLSYVRQYALDPPTEQRQKRRRQKLKTFTVRKDTTKRLNTRLKQATMLLSSAYSGLQTSNPGHTQTFPLPLALCTPHGEIRTCAKSKFRDVPTDIFPSCSVFIPQCPALFYHRITQIMN